MPPAIRGKIVDLKAEHPAFDLDETASVVGAGFGRKPDTRRVGRVPDEEPLPPEIVRSHPPYREVEHPQ